MLLKMVGNSYHMGQPYIESTGIYLISKLTGQFLMDTYYVVLSASDS